MSGILVLKISNSEHLVLFDTLLSKSVKIRKILQLFVWKNIHWKKTLKKSSFLFSCQNILKFVISSVKEKLPPCSTMSEFKKNTCVFRLKESGAYGPV